MCTNGAVGRVFSLVNVICLMEQHNNSTAVAVDAHMRRAHWFTRVLKFGAWNINLQALKKTHQESRFGMLENQAEQVLVASVTGLNV